ncbi:hypothetical protein P171DRAFT_428059 [Karstenula rhodostoma CBS 690.94]|uniref:Uncharacterized protein n=1 Tax=Karstenula rhodostoma CBS 690.94 TaxID=1392251 RepID=A0A9P4PW07_9PLEO|nr:hypothetical protein P171DRAFT_428059 [Karstenula rhodostoma CBS 690.94]
MSHPMSSTDNITALLYELSLNDATRHRPKSTTPPESFLHSMNEKLSQRPRKQRSRKQGGSVSWRSVNLTPVSPSIYYTVEDQRDFLGVYSSTATATKAARLAGAWEDYLSKWVDEGLHDCGNKVRILPQKLIEKEETKNENEKDGTGDGKFLGAPTKDDAKKQDSKPLDALTDEPDQDPHIIPDASHVSANGGPTKSTSSDARPILPSETPIQSIYVALDHSLCLGLFTEKSNAWAACMKHKTQLTYSVALTNEKRWVDKDGLPFLKGTISGGGGHCWYVRLCTIDEMPRPKHAKRRV